MADKVQVLRETDDDARLAARLLVRAARFMALAAIDPDTGYPSASRVLTATDLDGVPVILVSDLSTHTRALLADGRCSLLAGEPGKGDPLAHPRITLHCDARPVARDEPAHARIRERFLDRHPKAELYVDFADFRFFRLVPKSASMNGGFGRAFALPGSDLVIALPADSDQWLDLQKRLKSMTNAANDLAGRFGIDKTHRWRIGGIDPAGLDLVAGDVQQRHEFGRIMSSAEEAMHYIFQSPN